PKNFDDRRARGRAPSSGTISQGVKLSTKGNSEQVATNSALAEVRRLAKPLRLRVIRDVEGFPVIPGRYGRIEWFDGRDLAPYGDRPRLFLKLWAIPGVRRWQTGDREMRALFPPEALEQVAGIIRARRRRTLDPEAARKRSGLPTVRATSRPQDRGEALPLSRPSNPQSRARPPTTS